MRQPLVRARRRLTLIAVALVVSAGVVPASAKQPEDQETSRYIVILDDASSPKGKADEHAKKHGGELAYVYEAALRGYAADFSAKDAEKVRHERGVKAVEADGPVEAFATTQTGATWGLDRIDQPSLPLNTTYTYDNNGAGVKVYVLDTGIRRSHSDFGGRAITGYDAVTAGGSANDCHGHGTHVAGTIGGSRHGVAKGVTLVAVRVLGCAGTGTISGIVAGLDWVTKDHAPGHPAVVNMSLGSGASTALDTAVRNSIADGITYTVAAGNGNILGIAQDACIKSPARVADALTIGATDKTDKKASWSNYGNSVDWFAPGVSVVSDSSSSDTATATMSGTSMAAPHVAGVAAQYLQTVPAATPSAVRTALFAKLSAGKVLSARTTNNHLVRSF